MSMNLKDALALIELTVSTDATISAHCSEVFGKAQSVLIGINPLNPPKLEEHCPVIAVWVGGRARISDQSHRIHTVNVGVGIRDEEQIISGKVRRFCGLATLDDFTNVVEAAVTKALNTAGFASTQEAVHEDENTYPYFRAVITYLIRCPSRL